MGAFPSKFKCSCISSCDVEDDHECLSIKEFNDSLINGNSFTDWSFVVQSQDIINDNIPSVTSDDTEQNVAFGKSVDTEPMDIPFTLSSMQMDGSKNVELGDFLSRPVLIATYDWTENTDINESLSPWLLFFNNTAVKSKLDYYSLIRCNLNVKFIINASPFYYSCAMVSYRPLSNKTSFDSYEPCAVNGGTGLDDQQLLGRSQRPKVFLYPQDSQGAVMKLPFFWPKNWLDATLAKDFEDMGTLNIDSLNFVLTNANSVVATDANIQVYAWASEVELAGPTIDLSVQSKDEYGKGPISKPASAIARMTGAMANVPIIGPFATATSMISQSVSDVASLFGYTNVPVIADVHAYNYKPNPNFAATDIGIPVEKLTLDSKNELSIDPKISGLDLHDELSIKSIVSREAFLDTYTWTSAQAPNSLIFITRVSPEMVSNSTVTGVQYIQGTPSWMVSRFFKYWRGDMIFKFKFLCSKYHRGRVKISWDPHANIFASTETTNLVYTKIVDITEENDVEFLVPYTQSTSYLLTDRANRTLYGTTDTAFTTGTINGTLTVKVLTTQTSPVASADIGVSVFVRGADNLEFADPLPPSPDQRDLTMYTVQSKDIVYTKDVNTSIGVVGSTASDFINMIHMGENITSLRTLLRRSFYHRSVRITNSELSNNSINTYESTAPRMPYFYGFTSNALDLGVNALAVSTDFNYVSDTPINTIGACFIGNRGSVIWHVNQASKSTDVLSIGIQKWQLDLTQSRQRIITAVTNSTASAFPYAIRRSSSDVTGGISLADNKQQHGAHASIPYYNNYKFSSNNPNYRDVGTAIDNTISDSFTVSTVVPIVTSSSSDSITLDYYCGIGTDFTFLFFLNVPGYALQDLPLPG